MLKYMELAGVVTSVVANNNGWLQLKAETAIHILQTLLKKFFSVSAASSPSYRARLQPERSLTMLPSRAKLGKNSFASLSFQN